LLLVAAALVLAGATAAVWPLRANGVRGSAIAPHYRDFYVGVTSYQPLPQHVTVAQLRRLGARLPGDAVDQRRRLAAGLAATGLILALSVTLSTQRRRYSAEGAAVTDD
jgi:hypothetical protein